MRVFVTSNGAALVQRHRWRAQNIAPALVEAEERSTRERFQVARALSGTTYASTAQLRRMGHPYGRSGVSLLSKKRGGRGTRAFTTRGRGGQLGWSWQKVRGALPMPAWVLNLQSGTLYRSWHWATVLKRGSIISEVWNTAPWAQYMVGTRLMIARPILEKVWEITKQARFLRQLQAMARVVKAGG